MKILFLITGFILIGWGIVCLYGSFINTNRLLIWMSFGDLYIPKKIFGKYYKRVLNLVFGLIELTAGVFLVNHFFDLL